MDNLIKTMNDCQFKLDNATTLDEIRGLEGAAAVAYFKGFKLLLPETINFPGRRRRPPKDPVNVLLSLGYTVLLSNVHHFVRLNHLNAHMGHLHTPGPGSMALVSDLMEEFRSLVVDSVVLTLVRSGEIGNTDFIWEPDEVAPCVIKADARKRFITALEAKFRSGQIHPQEKRVMDVRSIIRLQVEHYRSVIVRNQMVYKGFHAK